MVIIAHIIQLPVGKSPTSSVAVGVTAWWCAVGVVSGSFEGDLTLKVQVFPGQWKRGLDRKFGI